MTLPFDGGWPLRQRISLYTPLTAAQWSPVIPLQHHRKLGPRENAPRRTPTEPAGTYPLTPDAPALRSVSVPHEHKAASIE